MLLGRERECARLVELLGRTRTGTGGALVVRGEAGIGKSALLDYAAERAEAMNVVRAVGVESEAELEFSALLEVCWPLRDRLADISERQADERPQLLVATDDLDCHLLSVIVTGQGRKVSPVLAVAGIHSVDAQLVDQARRDQSRLQPVLERKGHAEVRRQA